MFTKLANFPDLLPRLGKGAPTGFRRVARFGCSDSSSEEVLSKSYLRFLRSLKLLAPDVEAGC